jgi:hypothetical protein
MGEFPFKSNCGFKWYCLKTKDKSKKTKEGRQLRNCRCVILGRSQIAGVASAKD